MHRLRVHAALVLAGVLVLAGGPTVAAADKGATRSATSSTSSYLAGERLPAPLLALTQERLGRRSTTYSVEGRSVAGLAHRVSTTTVCEYARPGRLTELHLSYEVTSESVLQADPDSGITLVIDYAHAAAGPWHRLPYAGLRLPYAGALDPMLRVTVGIDGLLTTTAGERARRLYLRVRSAARIEGNVAWFSDRLRVDC